MSLPVLIMIDVQQEYITPGRPFHLAGIAPSLQNARRLLAHARQNKWQIVHVQHIQSQGIFSKAEGYADFVEGFEPLPGEVHVVKGNYSSYSSPEFVEFLAKVGEHPLVVAGYGSTMCCLSTIIDGYHRGHKFIFAHDASWSKMSGTLSEESRHIHSTETLRTFSEVKAVDQITQMNS